MSREFEEILQEINTLLTRADAKPPYTVEWLDKGDGNFQVGDHTFKGQQANIETDVNDPLLKDPNVVVGAFRTGDGRANLVQPWGTSASLVCGFRGNMDLITKAPNLLQEILDLFVEQPEPEPIPEPVSIPPVPPVKLRSLPKVAKRDQDSED